MGRLRWNEAFSVGDLHLDSEHRVLLGLINRLHEVEGQGEQILASALQDLVNYAEVHFGHEEALMEEGGFPELVAHRALHDRFRHQLAGLMTQANANDPALLEELRQFLAAWWRHHILEEDRRYRPSLP